MHDLIVLVGFSVIAGIGWAIYRTYIWPNYISPLRKIPGPPSESLIYGNFQEFMTKEEPQIEWIKKYGKIVKFYDMFNQPAILVTDPTVIQDITTSNTYDYLKPLGLIGDAITFIGKGLLFSEGDDHKRQKKMMNPAFTYSNIKRMVPTFTQVAYTLKGIVEDKINSGESNIELAPYISQTTLDIIGLVGFNYEFKCLTSQNELADAYNVLMSSPSLSRLLLGRLSNFFPFLRDLPLESNIRFKHARDVVSRETRELVAKKSREAEKGELKGNDLLTILFNINKSLPIEEQMTDEELRNQIMTFLLAGHETTSIATFWALHLLARFPHEQDLLREELVKAFPDKSNFNPTFDEINSLEYLNCIVKETLRLYSPSTFVRRVNAIDKVFGDYLIPKNTMIMISTTAIHKSTEIWGPTAKEFDPKRWLDPALTKNISNLSFIPFNTGSRSCIGSKLALAEFKVLLSMFIRNFGFQLIEGSHVERRTFANSKPDSQFKFNISKIES